MRALMGGGKGQKKGGEEKMPIQWSAVRVNDAMDMIELLYKEAKDPLDQASLLVEQAKEFENLPEYMLQRLSRLDFAIERMDDIGRAIESVRRDIHYGAIEKELDITKHGLV